jgi:hypothetical protein
MKKSNSKLIFSLALSGVFLCSILQAQVPVNMAVIGVTAGSPFSIAPPAPCFFNFYDNGGPGANYSNSANANVTFLPSNAATHRIQATFTTFSLEPGFDAFYIFNSNTVGVNQVPGPQGVTFFGFPAGNWQNISPGTVTANTGIAAVGANAAEALTFQFRSDGSIGFPGWTAIVREVPKDPCAMSAPPAQTVATGPGAMGCFVNVNTALPSFLPVGCNTGYQLRYRINGGAATVVLDPLSTTISVPVGFNIVTWELVDPCSGAIITTANQSVTVNDDTVPKITCPANTTFNLNAGECSKIFDYSVACADNCPFSVTRTVNHPIDFNSGQAGIMFDIVNLSANPLTITQFGPSLDAGNWPMEVYYTNVASTWVGHDQDPSAWTLAGALTVTSVGPGAGTAIPGYGITVPAGQSLGIYLTSNTGAPLNYTTGVRQVNDGTLNVSSSPGAGKLYPFAGTHLNRSYNGFVRYVTSTNQAPVQLSGLPSGASFPIGTTTNIFRCTDASGFTSTCSFTVLVKDNANPTWSLTCNDFITVALGDDCMGQIGADDVLEGNNYHCYDNYVVELDKIPPYGNGPWVPAILTAADVGKTYKVRVTEPLNGNKCSADVKIIDAEPPPLDCSPSPVTIPCNFPTDPTFTFNTTLSLRFPVTGLPVTVVDNQTREFEIPVTVSPGAVVNDVDFRTDISGDAFFNNLRIQVESPSGTIVTVWDQLGGCAPAPLAARFDDEGSAIFNCATYTSDINAQIPLGFGVLSSFDNELATGAWKIRITDMDGGLDVSSINVAELYITMTGTFGAGFPNGLTAPPVTAIGPNTYNVPAGLLDDCSATTLTYFDQTVTQNCSSIYTKIINRRWTATDASGNSTTCMQVINLLRPTFSDITPPPNYDNIDLPGFGCGSPYPTPAWIESNGLQGFPYAFGFPDLCNLNTAYIDNKIGICDGSYDIVRNWTVIDPCLTMGSMQYEQIIHVRDISGPTFIDCPVDMIETTDPYTCCASFNFPDILVEDDCSQINDVYALVLTIDPFSGDTIAFIPVDGNVFNFPGNLPNDPDTLASFGNMPCIPIGHHIVVYFAEDDCGNVGTCSFNLVVADFSPPQPACDETTVVSIGVDDPTDCYYNNANGCEFAGVTWVHAETFDDGSYDQCSPIKFTIRRVAPYSDCIKDLDHTPCSGNANDFSEYELATAESDSIKFYCCETGTTQMVILRVYQLNYDGTYSTYPDGTRIYNECQVEVTVQDKLKPVCEPPFNVTVSCENFDPSLWIYGKAKAYDNCCLDATKEYQGQKGLTHSVNYTLFDSTCNKGTIVRTFRAFDCKGASSQCTQRIVVNYEQDYFIKFPDDEVVTVCNGVGDYGEPTFFGEDCELLGVSYEDQVFTVVPDACFKIERNWKVINWCTYNPQGTCISVPNPSPNSNLNHSTNMPGPIVSAPGTTGPWSSTVVKVYPNDVNATNYSFYWSPTANCYTYKQIIKVIDTQAPNIDCPASPVEFCDLTYNNPLLWNESYWYDAALESHDLCEGPADLNIVASDLCSGSNLNIRYLLLLDLDGDGTMETVVSSTNPPAAGTVNYNNVNSPNFVGGTVRNFDERPVSSLQKYKFGLQTIVTGNSVSAAVRWNTQASPNTYAIPELPYGTHKIKWIVGDGCGNERVCEYTFVVKDCKPPTVICTNGLSVNMMPTGMIVIYASDFLVHAEDNCTPEDYLEFGIRKSGTGTGFPVDVNGNPIVSLTFTCDEVGNQPVELWAIDAAGNADHCETFIVIQDFAGNCMTGMATVSGLLKTESGDGLEESDVELTGNNPSGPGFNHFDMTDQSGTYDFNHKVPLFSDYSLTPTKDDNPLNGVTTYDLVLISKHILGIQPLGSPYKMIAADANMSNSVTTFDIVELRKLILGVYQELPANTSWRFVDESFIFTNQDNPFTAPFPESKLVADIQTNAMADNFVAIKIGDVNNTVIPNSLMANEDRSVGSLVFDVDDYTVKAGETFEVKFKAAEKVTGYQFTLNHPDLELVDIATSDNMKADNFAIFPEESAITTSWNGDSQAAFTLKFRARRTGEISKMLTLSSRITKAEAYRIVDENQPVEALSIALRFNGKEGSILTGVGFELYQNQPNPFVNRTSIGFHLPAATTAHLTVYDQSGRLVYSQKGDFAKGYNTFMLDKAMINTTGVLFYTLETTSDAATKKMIQTK